MNPLHASGPPLAALVVASPAIAAGFAGELPAMTVVSILAVSLAVAWTMSAIGLRMVGAPTRRDVSTSDDTTPDTDVAPDDAASATSETEGSLP